MLTDLVVVAGRSDVVSRWLNQHPVVAGGMWIVVGLLMVAVGFDTYRSRRTPDANGNIEGSSVAGPCLRMAGGFGLICLGIHTILKGM